jgi:hypothetical protein
MAALSFGHPSFNVLKSPSGGNYLGQKYHLLRETSRPFEETSSSKSSSLNLTPKREGDSSDRKKGKDTTKGGDKFHLRESKTKTLISIVSAATILPREE